MFFSDKKRWECICLLRYGLCDQSAWGGGFAKRLYQAEKFLRKMIKFLHILPCDLDSLPEMVVKWLQNAIDRTPASTSRLDITLDIAKKGYGDMFIVTDGEDMTGVCYLLTYDTKDGKVLSPVLVGGKNLSRWKQDFHDFLYKVSGNINKEHIVRFIARKGWGKKYPECKVIGYIYEHRIGGV